MRPLLENQTNPPSRPRRAGRALLPARARRLGALLWLALLLPASCRYLPEGQVDLVRMPPLRSGSTSVVSPGGRPAAPPEEAPDTEGPLALMCPEAILLALQNNRELAVERLNPLIRETFEEEQRAAFDPVLSAEAAWSRDAADGGSSTGGRTVTDTSSARVGVEQFLPTGTTVGVEAGTERAESSAVGGAAQTRLGLTVSQAILRGFGAEVNLVSLRQARLDNVISSYELRGFAEALVASTENACWDCALAEKQISIFEDSLRLAQQQLADTEDRIAVGTIAEVERAAAQAEVALRKQDLIDARSGLATVRLQLLRLLNPPGSGLYEREVSIREDPQIPPVELEQVATHVQVALRMRPEINQSRLGILRDDLEIVRTRNGLLPKLDLFITLGKSGYADSFAGSVRDLGQDSYDVLLGLAFERPIGNLAARARHSRAALNRRQAEEALANLQQLVQLDVRAAYIEVQRAQEQVTATAATRAFRAEALRAETEKFGVGKSTSFLVAQAQRDLVANQIAEVRAAVNYRKALVNLCRQDGTLLVRRGVAAPGEGPPGAVQPPESLPEEGTASAVPAP